MRAVYSTTLFDDALLRQAALRAHGIESALWNESLATWVFGLPTGAVPLVLAVGPADAERAVAVLRDELERPPAPPDAESEALRARIRTAFEAWRIALLFYLLLNAGHAIVAYLVFLVFGKPPTLRQPAPEVPPEEAPPETWTSVPCRCGRSLDLPAGLEASLAECPWCGHDPTVPATPVEARPRRPRSRLAIGLAAATILLAMAAIPWAVGRVLRSLESGTEITYRVLFPEGFAGDRAAACKETVDVLLRRARKSGLEAEGSIDPPDRVILRIGVRDPAATAAAKRLLGRHAAFGLYLTATKEVQERFNEDGIVPPGFRRWENPDPRADREYEAWGGRAILLRERPVVDGRNIMSAEPSPQMGIRGSEWVVTFELDVEGARRFDEAAKVLYHQHPSGMIAIVMEGRIRSLPVVRAESFGGQGQITGGGGKDETKALAGLLSGGDLPFPVGRIVDGRPIPGEPETETPYGPGK